MELGFLTQLYCVEIIQQFNCWMILAPTIYLSQPNKILSRNVMGLSLTNAAR